MAEKTEINITEAEQGGAQLESKYHKATQDVVGVPAMEIKDAKHSAIEEVVQFSVGNFLASGAFWLGVERLLTVGYNDTVFLSCIAFLVCGVFLAWAGYRQSLRRVARLGRYVPDDDAS